MKSSLWIKTLFRSPVRTIVTWVLLLAAAFLMAQSLTDYVSTRRGLNEAKKQMSGVLTLEHAPALDPETPGNNSRLDMFLLTDPTAPGTLPEQYAQRRYHPRSITAGERAALAALPGVTALETRTMTAGVSAYRRPDLTMDEFLYEGRMVLEATLKAKEPFAELLTNFVPYDEPNSCYLRLEDVRILAGPEEAVLLDENGTCLVHGGVYPEEYRDQAGLLMYSIPPGTHRWIFLCFRNGIYGTDLETLEPGRRYVFVLRTEPRLDYYSFGGMPNLFMGDDTLLGWQPYITDVTDLPEDYLEGEEFGPLRELIQVTNDDWHTLDVVYTEDMSAIRRVADLRLVPVQGRFLEPEDAGQAVCVVSEAFAEQNGLGLGDALTLKLGDYPVEQHEVLGAVASTRGRYAENWTEQTFTIVGTWTDVSMGNYLKQDEIWAYSDAAVFVPASFLPGTVQREEFCPGEVSVVVEADAIRDFTETQLPLLKNQGWIVYWNDGGWPLVEEEMGQVIRSALYKLLAFGAATLLVLALTLYLYIARRSRDYAILRAMGATARSSGRSLLAPLLVLALCAAVPGAAAALLWYAHTGGSLAGAALPAGCAALGLPVLLGLAALCLLRRMGLRSPLTLLQAGGGQRK